MANNNSGRDKNEKDLVCSFCGKHQDEVERMIIGPGVNICSECIGLCHDLLSDKPERPSGSRAPRAGAGRTRSLQAADDLNINIMTPAEIKEGLDQYVIGQDEAKRVLAVSVYNHYMQRPVQDYEQNGYQHHPLLPGRKDIRGCRAERRIEQRLLRRIKIGYRRHPFG